MRKTSSKSTTGIGRGGGEAGTGPDAAFAF